MSFMGERDFWIVMFDATAWDTQGQAEKHAKAVCDGSMIHHVVTLTLYAAD
jgi:hypothetical protein